MDFKPISADQFFLKQALERDINYLTSYTSQVQKDKTATRHLQLKNEADFNLRRSLRIIP